MRLLRVLLLCVSVFHYFSVFSYAQAPTGFGHVNVSASIPPGAGSIEFLLSASEPQATELGEGDEVTFTISYRSLATSSYPLTIETYWEQGLIEGSGGSYIDVYEYVISSASEAHDGTDPVVDLMNNKITWEIPALAPSASAHEVTYTLRVRSDLPTNNRVEVYTKARGEFSVNPIPEQSYLLYAKKDPSTPTPTPTITLTPSASVTPNPSYTLTPTPTSKPGSTSTPTPRPTDKEDNEDQGKPKPTPTTFKGRTDIPPFTFDAVDIEQLTDNYAQISTQLSIPTGITMNYWICGDKTKETIVSEVDQEVHLIDLFGLNPNTNYCFQLLAQDAPTKRKIQSDIFTFKTASDKEQFQLENQIIIWNNMILSSGKGKKEKLITPLQETIVISLELKNPESIEELKGSFQSTSILGANTITQAHIEQVKFIEMSPGIFSAEIASPQQKGFYKFVLDVQDVYGSFVKKQLDVTFVVSDPIKIINGNTKLPIENALVSIDRMEESTQRYKSLRDSFFFPHLEKSVFFPYYTNQKGILNMVLPSGIYKLEVSAIGYETAYVDLSLGVDTLEYPTISLSPRHSIDSYTRYTLKALQNTFTFIPFYGNQLFSTRTLLVSSLFVYVFLFIVSGILVSIKQQLYKNINQSSPKIVKLRLFLIQCVKVTLILILFLGVVFAILFTLYQNIFSSLPFIVATLLLLAIIISTRTKREELG